MEEQILPWWKRALRAAIGSLKSGFGLFGRTQTGAEPEFEVAKAEEEAAERIVEAGPKIEAAAIEESAMDEAVEEVEVEGEITTADPSTALRSAQNDNALGEQVLSQDDNALG